MLFVYINNPFWHGRQAPLRVKVEGRYIKKTSKITEIGIDSGVIEVAGFNSDIKYSG